jgi:hypothetical protein
MLSRVIYKKQRGRRLLTALAVVSVAAGTLLVGSAALAVNATGAFELDGNAITSHTGTGAPDDADRVCYQHAITTVANGGLGLTAGQASAKCFSAADTATPGGTNGATATTWIDSTTNLEIFTGGGSKDPQDPGNDWLWKPKDTIPDKDTIDHAFAARYSLAPSTTTCPSNGAPTCDVIFFGVDRFDNSGDAQLGFWFFKNAVATTNTASSGGFKFSGHHVNGDLLVISDFSNGGSTATIAAYFWDTTCLKAVNNPTAGQCGAINLRLQAISTNANCATSAGTAAFCGITNVANGGVAPWAYTDKSGNHSYLQGEYYEAGLNLSSLGLSSACFSSFEGESRSSTSPTAVLKDFVLGNFQNCSATAVTAPSSASVSPGTSVTDHILITGAGSGTPPNPSSPPNVVFAMCGPIATGICDSSTSAKTPTQIGVTKPLAHNSLPAGQSEATSDPVNTANSPLAPGRYCFQGTWAGDANYPAGASDNSAGECFTVIQFDTSTVTTPSDNSGTALSGTQALGASLYDKAVVTGTAAGGNPTGDVNFFVCSGSQLTGAPGAEVCAAGDGTALTGNPRALSPVSGSTSASSAISSPAVVASAAGVYCFRATYVPSGTIYTGSSDNGHHAECVTVGPETTTTVTTPQIDGVPIVGNPAVGASVTDHAVVTAFDNSDGTPTGKINFFICNPTQVATNGGTCSAGGTAAGSIDATAVANSNPPASQADSTAIIANAVGTWCFRAEYVPGGTNGANYTGSSDASTGECFTVKDTTGATSAQNWLPNDSATITSVGGTALNGTLSFTLYPGGSCTGTPLYQEDTDSVTSGVQPYSLTSAASPVTRITHNTSVLVSLSSTVSWKVVFTSSDPNVSSSNHCEVTVLTITN